MVSDINKLGLDVNGRILLWDAPSSEAVLQKCFAQENVYPRAIECVPDVVQLSL